MVVALEQEVQEVHCVPVVVLVVQEEVVDFAVEEEVEVEDFGFLVVGVLVFLGRRIVP